MTLGRTPLPSTERQLEHAVEAHGLAVDEHQLHFGVRHTQRLDHVFGGRAWRTAALERPLAMLGRQEFVQLLVEAERDDDGRIGLARAC